MFEGDEARLKEILHRLDIVKKICNRLGGVEAALEETEMAQPAIMMHLEICDEMVTKILYGGKLNLDKVIKIEDIRGLKAIRNITAHNYGGLDFDIVADVINHHLPKIEKRLKEYLRNKHEPTLG